jgi:hypothetical protein
MEATATALRESPLTPVMEHRFAPGRVRAASLLGSLAWFLAGTLFFCGVWLLVRRMSGSLAVPLDSGMLLAVGVCGVVSAATARLLWRRTSDEGTDPARLVRDLLPTVALVLLATAAAVPGSPTAAVILLWLIIAAEEIAAAWFARWPRGRREQRSIAAPRRSGDRSDSRQPRQAAGELDFDLANDIRQRQTRQRITDGKELVHGTLRSGFVTGQRTAIEHLVFCPMLAAIPQIGALAVDEADCTVRATHVYRYGARLEIRLREPCEEPIEVLVRYEARG